MTEGQNFGNGREGFYAERGLVENRDLSLKGAVCFRKGFW